MKKIIKLKNKYGMIVCVLFCMIYFCLGCGQEDETVFLAGESGIGKGIKAKRVRRI